MDAPAVKAASGTGVRIETRAVVAVGVAPPAADGSGGAAAVGSMVSAVTQPVTVTLHSRPQVRPGQRASLALDDTKLSMK